MLSLHMIYIRIRVSERQVVYFYYYSEHSKLIIISYQNQGVITFVSQGLDPAPDNHSTVDVDNDTQDLRQVRENTE